MSAKTTDYGAPPVELLPPKAAKRERAVLQYQKARSKNAGYIEGTPGKENWRVVLRPQVEAKAAYFSSASEEYSTPRMYSETAAARMLVAWREAFGRDGKAKAPAEGTIDCAVVVDAKGPSVRVIRPPSTTVFWTRG